MKRTVEKKITEAVAMAIRIPVSNANDVEKPPILQRIIQ